MKRRRTTGRRKKRASLGKKELKKARDEQRAHSTWKDDDYKETLKGERK